MTIRLEVAARHGSADPRGSSVLETIRSFLDIPATGVRCVDAYLIDADLNSDEIDLVRDRFTDSVVQRSEIGKLDPGPYDFAVCVGFRPGVTDAVGRSAAAAIRDIVAPRRLPDRFAVHTSRLYFLEGVNRTQADKIARGLLANELIERFEVIDRDEYMRREPDLGVPLMRSLERPCVQHIDIAVADEQLLQVSRERVLSLSLAEMQAIAHAYADEGFRTARLRAGLGNCPTDVELECLAQTWSEHCKHKIFHATIHMSDAPGKTRTIRSLFREHIQKPTERIRERQIAESGSSWLVSVFHDNAGVIALTDRWHLVYKVETHNSPSALDPYGGAMTGIVGVNRDPFGTGLGAELLVNVWGYCFADPRTDKPLPQGLMHPRRIRDGVHHGVIDGGNQSGIPYGRGWELFDDRYLGKPLVYCGTVGRMPTHVCGRPAHHKTVLPGHRIVMCGGRIGKDGIHGATFSSAGLDESSPVQAVQIGDPITQKSMFDFLIEARDLGLYDAITDNGAGGLSSSVGELCAHSGGAELHLDAAPLKYAGLHPWEILLSEAQERMTLAVPPDKLAEFLQLASRREVEATDLGVFTDSGVFDVRWEGRSVCYLPLTFLHEGVPTLELRAVWRPEAYPEPVLPHPPPWEELLLAVLKRPNIASGEKKARHYDHEVKGLSIVKPWVGKRSDLPSDASVFLVEHGRLEGFVLSEGINPFFSDIDTWWMTASVVDEAVRKAVGAGAELDHMAGLDNYCWPDPVQSERNPDGEHKLAQLVRSTEALAWVCEAYGVPCISGKDSMKNDSYMGGVKISIPPTLLFSAIGRIENVTLAVTPDAKVADAAVYLLGATHDELGGSELYRHLGGFVGNAVPKLDPSDTLPLYRAVQQAIRRELLQSCHAPTKGGLAVALAKIAIGGDLGLDVDLDRDPYLACLRTESALFSESNGRFMVTAAPEHARELETLLPPKRYTRIGTTISEPVLRVRHGGREVLRVPVSTLRAAWKETLDAI